MEAGNSLIIRNIKQLLLTEDTPKKWVAGKEMKDLPAQSQAFLWIENGIIKDFGPMSDCPNTGNIPVIEADGQFVFPAWCDSHTHLVYAAPREKEFVMRIKGIGYEEIAKQGGGILNSAKRLQETPEEELFESAWERHQEIIGFGTGAVEIKSGYGLTLESELKMLRVIRRIREKSPLVVKSTFLGAHAVPAEYKGREDDYVDHVIQDMLPRVADEGLADFCDVFCDRGFFTEKQTDRILQAASKYGLRAKIHANELDYSGGVQVGVRNNALSVDHLECVGDREIDALKDSETMPTLLPSTAFFLSLTYAPARKMIDHGLPVALATDYNPGSTPSGNMPFVLALASIKMNMLPEEALHAATLNGAYALELEKTHGSICRGKTGNVILTKKMPSLAFFPYAFGSDLIDKVIIKGEIMSDRI